MELLIGVSIIIDIDIDNKGQVPIDPLEEKTVTAIALRQIRKTYGSLQVIHDVDIDIASGEFLVLVGPSGCGKSTLLRMIAGLEEISGGVLDIGGKVVNALPPSERDIAMVFQDYALYPHMSVRENMAFGLKMRGTAEETIDRRVSHAAGILKIEPFLDRRPAQLSGGQRQRVAMGRAIVREPSAFLFDEPLSNLDAALRVEMRLEIAKLHNRMKATTVYVTHDQVEAMTLADRIVVLNAGQIEQIGAPLDLYHRPASLFVARFIGSPTMNTMTVELTSDGKEKALHFKGRNLLLAGASTAQIPPGAVTLGIRPEDLTVCPQEEAWFSGDLAVAERLGSQTYGYVEIGEARMLTVEFPRDTPIRVGDPIHVRPNTDAIHLFEKVSGLRIN